MFKLFLIKFILFLYKEHIYEDFSVLNTFGKIIIFPFWILKILYIILLLPFFILDYFWVNSKIYKVFDDAMNMRNIGENDSVEITITKTYINKK